MNIGITTWGRGSNYGASLQAIALVEYVRKLGYSAEYVHYRQGLSALNLLDVIGRLQTKTIKGVVQYFCWIVVALVVDGFFWARLGRIVKTRFFLNRYLKTSEKVYRNYDDLRSLPDKYDTLISGSDQIWNPNYLDSEASYLLGNVSTTVKRISYASSVVEPAFGDKEPFYNKALPLFSAISSRERLPISNLERVSGQKVAWVVDPTLLLSKDDWTAYLELNCESENNEIFVYWLSELEKNVDAMISLGHKMGLRVRVFTDYNLPRVSALNIRAIVSHLKFRYKLFRNRKFICVNRAANARDLLRHLVNSRYVLSDSFHTLMFSSIFKKNAKIVIQEARIKMSARILDYLDRLRWDAVVCSSIEDDIFEQPSSCAVGSRDELDRWIRESRDWLSSKLSE